MKFATMLREHKFSEAEKFAYGSEERDILLFCIQEAKYGRNETDLGRGVIISLSRDFSAQTELTISLPPGRGTVVSW